MEKLSIPKMALVMIVKNESHIIKETLEKMTNYIDYYVISDTGSSDNTIEIIKNYFNEKGIKGEIYRDRWRDFGFNRTLAFKHASGKSEYMWVIDADDLVVGNLKLPEKMDADGYMLTYGDKFTYKRMQIFKNYSEKEYQWKYVGLVHEYPDTKKPGYRKVPIEGDYFINSRRLGARNLNSKKYERDAKMFERGLIDEISNERYMFYLAQSYYDSGNIKKGIECYEERVHMGGWPEEIYYSLYRIGTGKEQMRIQWEKTEEAYMRCYDEMRNINMKRAEPLNRISSHYLSIKDYDKAYKFAKLGCTIPFPNNLLLFIEKDVYDLKIHLNLGLSAYYMGKYEEAYGIFSKLLENKNLDKHEINNIKRSVSFCEDKLKDISKKNLCIFLGQVIPEDYNSFSRMILSLANIFKVHVVGDRADFVKLIDKNEKNKKINYYGTKHTKGKTYDFTILFDNINMLIRNSPKNNDLKLYMKDSNFKYYVGDYSHVEIKNNVKLNSFLKKIKLLLAKNEKVKNELMSEYGISENKICLFDYDNDFELSDKIKNTYNAEVYDNNEVINVKLKKENISYKYFDHHPESRELYLNVHKDIETIETFYEMIKKNIDDGNLKFVSKELEKELNHVNNKKKKNKTINPRDNDIYNYLNILYYDKLGDNNTIINLSKKILLNDNVDDKMRLEVEKIRDQCVNKIKDDENENGILSYPLIKIENMVKKLKKINDTKIILSITTCKRYDLFSKTMNSFINCCEDILEIDDFICVDDNSSNEDKEKMKEQYPFFNFIFKDEKEKGHSISMNIIRDYAINKNAKYLLHLEDDFHFVNVRKYIHNAKIILENNESYGQLLFNKKYAEEPTTFRPLDGDELKKINHQNKTIRYFEHIHYPPGSREYNNYIRNMPRQQCYWPHYSFRPSLIKVKVLNEIGRYYNTSHFEIEYAKEYTARGYKTAFYDDFCCIHIGKKTWEKNEANSYSLNGTPQFSMDNKELSMNILCDIDEIENLNAFKKFKDSIKDNLPFYKRYSLNKVTQLSNNEKNMYMNNEFNYDRDIVNNVSTIVEILSSNNSDNCAFMNINKQFKCQNDDKLKIFTENLFNFIKKNEYDAIILNTDSECCDGSEINKLNLFEDKIEEIDTVLGENETNHIINHQMTDENEIQKNYQLAKKLLMQNGNECLYPKFFVLSKSGKSKLLSHYQKNGVKNIKDVFNISVFNNVYVINNGNLEFNNIEYEKKIPKSKLLDKYVLYSNMDSSGGDLMDAKYGLKLEEMLMLSESIPNCVAFNTLGWFKSKIVEEDKLIYLYNSNKYSDGMYVKKSYLENKQNE